MQLSGGAREALARTYSRGSGREIKPMCISGVELGDLVLLLSFGLAAARVAELWVPLWVLNLSSAAAAREPRVPRRPPLLLKPVLASLCVRPRFHLRRLGWPLAGSSVRPCAHRPLIRRSAVVCVLLTPSGRRRTRSSADSRLTGWVHALGCSVVLVCGCVGRCSLPARLRPRKSPYPAWGCEWASPMRCDAESLRASCKVSPTHPLAGTAVY